MKKSGLVLLLVLGCALVIGALGCVDLVAGTSDTDTTILPVSSTTEVAPTTTTTTVAPTGPPTHWTKLEPTNEPSARYGHAMVYDPTTDKVILFGGMSAKYDCKDDTWAFDPGARTWNQLHPAGAVPSARRGHAMVYTPTTGKVLLFGGCQFLNDPAPAYKDLWAYDPVADTWTELYPAGAVPPAREGHAMVYDPENGKVILFGGRDFARENGFGDLWSYDTIANAWTELHPAGGGPGACSHHAMVYDPTLAKIIIHGGYREGVSELDLLDSLWTYDPAANVWTAPQPDGTPGNRAGHAMVYHPGCGLTVLVGGECARELPSGGYMYPTFPETLWAYDPAANTWKTLKPADRFPYGRAGHSMVYDSKSGGIIMFGGYRLEDTSWGPMRREWLSGTWILTP